MSEINELNKVLIELKIYVEDISGEIKHSANFENDKIKEKILSEINKMQQELEIFEQNILEINLFNLIDNSISDDVSTENGKSKIKSYLIQLHKIKDIIPKLSLLLNKLSILYKRDKIDNFITKIQKFESSIKKIQYHTNKPENKSALNDNYFDIDHIIQLKEFSALESHAKELIFNFEQEKLINTGKLIEDFLNKVKKINNERQIYGFISLILSEPFIKSSDESVILIKSLRRSIRKLGHLPFKY